MPMTTEQKADMKVRIKKAEVVIKDAFIDIAAAKRAGLDVAEEEKEAKRIRDLLRGVKRVYG